MFELLIVVLFCWLFFGTIRLSLKITWGLTKVFAVILFILALPVLAVCLLFAGGVILLLPVAMIALAWGMLKVCA